MSGLQIEGLRVRIGPTSVLCNVALTALAKTWTALVGPNGAGKTTLLRAIAGAVRHTGTIASGTHYLHQMSRRERAALIAYAPQEPTFPPGCTVERFVMLGRSAQQGLLGLPSERDREAVADAMEHLDLAQLARRRVEELSGGERRRAVLAQALAQEAALLLLDEPTTALDIGHQQELLDHVDRIRNERGITVLSAMHDLTLAGQYADCVVLLDHGRVVTTGTAAEVLTEQRIAEHFGARVEVWTSPDGHVSVQPRRAPAGRPSDNL